MATSTNYGWAEPDNSSLVKNGASDIRTLGNAIDVSLWNSGFGQAGKNKVINGNFGIWQRGTSITYSVAGSFTYTADRFNIWHNGSTAGTVTASQQTFTPATAPVAGYEGTYFHRTTITTLGSSQTILDFNQRIEDVRVFAGNTVTLSFWLKSSGTYTPSVFLQQNFGSGGSSTVDTAMTLTGGNTTTAWQRYTATVAVPSISGKTIGTSSYLNVLIRNGSPANGQTSDIWGVQLEYGSTATPFQTASGGSPQAELAMCQRYYVRFGSSTYAFTGLCPSGYIQSTTLAVAFVPLPVQMRVIPTATDYSALQVLDASIASYTPSAAAVSAWSSPTLGALDLTISVGVAARFATVRQSATTGYLGFSAEL